MNLTVAERINLLNLLPREGNAVTLRTILKLKTDVSFSEEEIKDFDIQAGDNNIRWNLQKAKEKDIDITDMAKDIIVKKLTELDKQNKLTEQTLTLYDKFK